MDAVIDTVNFTVTAEVEYGTTLSDLVPTIGISAGASIDPLSEVAQDFSGGAVNYTVTAQDASTQVWVVTVAAVAPIEVADLAALRAGIVDDKTVYKVTGEVVLTYQQDYYNKKYCPGWYCRNLKSMEFQRMALLQLLIVLMTESRDL